MGDRDCLGRLSKKNTFTIHGLWPGYSTGERIADCNTGPDILVKLDDKTTKKMNKYWPSLKGPNADFWAHEFNKHGLCYTAAYKLQGTQPFFEKTLSIYQNNRLDVWFMELLDTWSQEVDITGLKELEFTYDDLVYYLGSSRPDLYFDITCRKKQRRQFLMEIRISFDLNFRPHEYYPESNCNASQSIYVMFDN
jgi:ribonuclease I